MAERAWHFTLRPFRTVRIDHELAPCFYFHVFVGGAGANVVRLYQYPEPSTRDPVSIGTIGIAEDVSRDTIAMVLQTAAAQLWFSVLRRAPRGMSFEFPEVFDRISGVRIPWYLKRSSAQGRLFQKMFVSIVRDACAELDAIPARELPNWTKHKAKGGDPVKKSKKKGKGSKKKGAY